MTAASPRHEVSESNKCGRGLRKYVLLKLELTLEPLDVTSQDEGVSYKRGYQVKVRPHVTRIRVKPRCI